ncbi:hypothetical protein L7F22_001153 [Adiantum nelumboides]|nr:hypothetical protein [Adiantum nelumboides]
MKGQYVKDEDFARIYDQIVNGQRHEHYTLKSDFLMMHGKLCVTKRLRPKVLIECHAPSYAGHRGIDATVKAVDTFCYWPTLRRDVSAFVRSCLVCQKVKFDRQKAPGLLEPLPILDKPWESIAKDFIFYLPRTPTENDGIWTIICRFSKQAHFVLVRKKIKSEHMVKLFMHNSFKYHGMPQSIVSDRDPRTRAACINAASLALADAGIPMRDIVASCASGYLNNTPLLDLNYLEDSGGGPDVTVALLPSINKITLLQMDAKLPVEMFERVFELGNKGCLAVASYMKNVRSSSMFVKPLIITVSLYIAQCSDPDKPTAPKAKQPKPIPVREITRSSGVVIEELPEEAPVPSKLNPKVKEWEQQRNTWKEKGKAKEFDEWKDQRELEAGTNEVPIDSFDSNSNTDNEQDEIEIKMCERIQQLTIELEDIRQSLPTVAKFIKDKRKQVEAMTVEVPKIKDDEAPVI